MGLMDKQMQAFALGGLKDEGGEIDEASGNRVPIGGTKEGVRDDIPANVSEGEFIFPADVVRYHGLDKMMALRQEAKMGLKQMERMGQMGNSEEATMPDDLPFGMADLIVVGGEGEPMEFAEGGFVPQMQTLQTAPVPTMGGGTSTGTQTPIVYDDFMKTPVVTMQEYRDANGNSIIITSVNGKATTEIPAGYTLYVPPTNAAPTATQAAIQTANNYSYQTSGGDEGPDTPRELQVDPDYASMDNDTYFSTMERQNSFGGKAGNAAAMGIALAMGPFGLLTMGMLQADKRRQLVAAEQRIAAETNPTKKKAYQATFAKMGGKTKEPEEENALVKFGKGFVAAVGGLFGLGNNDVEKVASVAGGAAADNTNVVSTEKQAPAATPLQVEGMGSPLSPVVAPVTSERTPTGLTLNQSDAMQTRDQAQIALNKVAAMEAAKTISPTESTMDIMGGVGTEFTPAPPTGTSTVVTQPPPMQSNDANVTTTPKIETTAKPARPKPGESTLEVAQQTQRPLTIPSGGVDDTAAIQAGMKPIAQAAGTPTAGYDRQPVNRAEFERGARGTVDFFGSTEQFQARELLAEAARNERNMPGSTYTLEANLINRYGFDQLQNAGLLNDGQIYARPSLLKDGSFRPDTIEGSEILADGVTPKREAPKSQVFFDGSMYPKTISPVMTPSPQPSPAIERPVTQTDAALGAQTDYGRRIAESMAKTAAEPVRGTDVAGPINTAIPTAAAAQTSVTDKVPESPDATRRYGPDELSYIDDRTFRDTGNIAADADYNLQRTQTLVDQGQQAAYNARRANERAQAEIQPFISSPFTDVAATDDSMGLPTGPLPDDPRDIYSRGNAPTNIQKEGVTYGAPDRLSDSELSLGRARNVSMMPDPYTEIFDTPAFDSSTKPTETTQALGEPFAAEKTKRYDAFGDEIKEVSTDIKDFATPMDAPSSKVEAKKSTAARTSKGTSTRKAAPTGDDRRSEPNFLERAFGIEPAKISARRGNDGVLYRTQADKREADKRQEDAKTIQRNSDRYKAVNTGYTDNSGKKHARGQAARDAFNKDNAADISTRHGGDKEDSGGKIVCSAMNNAYGFGSFRNKIWLEHSKNNLTKEHQVGYHRMFLPLIHLGYNKDYKFIRKCLEHIARHRTADIYFQSKSNKRDTLGMVYRTILEPICYLVGMFPTSKDNK